VLCIENLYGSYTVEKNREYVMRYIFSVGTHFSRQCSTCGGREEEEVGLAVIRRKWQPEWSDSTGGLLHMWFFFFGSDDI